jgi:chromosome segregation ATPase
MNLQETLSNLPERITQSVRDILGVKEDASAAIKRAENAEAKVASLQDELAASLVKLAKVETEAKSAQEAVSKKDEEIAKLQAAAKTVEEIAAKKAAEIAASAGQRPVQTKDGGSIGQETDILTRINQISDPLERAKFIRANRAALRSAHAKKPRA